MSRVEQWYNECDKLGNCAKIIDSQSVSYFYKGFKISKYEGFYIIVDVRKSDMYNPLNRDDYKVLLEQGFIKGANLLSHKNNLRKIRVHKKLIEQLTRQKEEYEKQLESGGRINFLKKKIRNCQSNIDENISLLSMYEIKVKLYKQQNESN